MTDNTMRFDGLANAYDRHRPGYPLPLFETVIAQAPAETKRAMDVAAGTGISTEILLKTVPSNWQITALEPSADMRGVLTRRFAGEPRIEIIDGTAEAMDVSDGSIGLMTVCIAFHWFNAERFLAEARRVLLPGGVLAVMSYLWNKHPVTDAFEDYLFKDDPAHYKELVHRKATQEKVLGDAAGFQGLQEHGAHTQKTLTADELINLLLTRSASKALVQKYGKKKIVADLTSIYQAHMIEPTIEMVYNAYAFTVTKLT